MAALEKCFIREFLLKERNTIRGIGTGGTQGARAPPPIFSKD
jgi:hypothetical protein